MITHHDFFAVLSKVLPYLPNSIQSWVHEWVGSLVNEQCEDSDE